MCLCDVVAKHLRIKKVSIHKDFSTPSQEALVCGGCQNNVPFQSSDYLNLLKFYDIVGIFQEIFIRQWRKKMLVKNWMSKEVITVEADDSMQSAIFTLQEHKIKILPVLKQGKLVGIITDRDLKKASPSDATTLDMHELMYLISKVRVGDIMEKKVITIQPDLTIEEAAAILLENRISGLPVLDENNQLVGVITQNDIFRAIISLTGMGKKGVQFAVRFRDMPGPIKETRELISNYGARTASILSSGENAPQGYLNVYFRIYDLERDKLPSLITEIQKKGVLLYLVDHRKETRTIYEEE